jgi:hypothetical protein
MLYQHQDHKINGEFQSLYDEVLKLRSEIARLDSVNYKQGVPKDWDIESGAYVGTGAGLTVYLQKKIDLHGLLITRTDGTTTGQVLWTKEMAAVPGGRRLDTGVAVALITGGIGQFAVVASALSDAAAITFSYLAWGRYNNEAARP